MKPSLQERIAATQERIVKAESERDGWRASGMQEKYLEAYTRLTGKRLSD